MSLHKHWVRHYKALRKALPEALSPRAADKDWSSITSDRRGMLSIRTFFLGEIFHIYPRDSETRNPGRELALVTRKQTEAHAPVEMAPSTLLASPEHWIFKGTMENGEKIAFLLYYRRPIFRGQVGRHLGTLDALGKGRLAQELYDTPL